MNFSSVLLISLFCWSAVGALSERRSGKSARSAPGAPLRILPERQILWDFQLNFTSKSGFSCEIDLRSKLSKIDLISKLDN